MNNKISEPDFSKYNPIFDNTYEKVGPEFGDLDASIILFRISLTPFFHRKGRIYQIECWKVFD